MKLLVIVFLGLVLSFSATAVCAEALTAHQKAFIDQVLVKMDLNIYGDPEGTVYPGGSPLFDESTGQTIDRHDYVLRNNPHILDNFTSAPADHVDRVVGATHRLTNDFDARRVPGRAIQCAVRESEEAISALVESVAVAVEARDFKAVAALFDRIMQLTDGELKAFSRVFKQARQMLQMPILMPVEMAAQVNALLCTLDRLEARLR